jgi:hypothetical protein
MTELAKETIVACVGAAFTGVPAMLLFWWTWLRDQERLKVQKLIDHWPTIEGKLVMAKDEGDIPSLGILIRNRSLFPVRVSSGGFRVDGNVIELNDLYLPSRLKPNPDANSNQPNIPDGTDPAKIRAGDSVQIRLRGQVDRDAIHDAVHRACVKRGISPEKLVLSRKVVALVALETGRIFSSLPFTTRLQRLTIEPIASIWHWLLGRLSRQNDR